MSAKEAQAIAQQLGDIPINSEKLQTEIQRLNRKGFVPLEQVQTPQMARMNNQAKANQIMLTDITEILTFQRV